MHDNIFSVSTNVYNYKIYKLFITNDRKKKNKVYRSLTFGNFLIDEITAIKPFGKSDNRRCFKKCRLQLFLKIKEKWPESFTIVPYRGPLLEKFAEKRVIVPYRGPLLVPYSGLLLVPYNGLPL